MLDKKQLHSPFSTYDSDSFFYKPPPKQKQTKQKRQHRKLIWSYCVQILHYIAMPIGFNKTYTSNNKML